MGSVPKNSAGWSLRARIAYRVGGQIGWEQPACKRTQQQVVQAWRKHFKAFAALILSVLFGATLANCGGGSTSVSTPAPSSPTPPSIATQPTPATVTAGETATFTVLATGTAPLSYQWQKNNTAIAGANSATYPTPATTAADNGSQFRVVVSNTAGSVTSNAATLTVNSAPVPPSITGQPANQSVTPGQTATFTVGATGTAPLTYQWQKNGTAILGATSSSYTTPPTASSDDGSQFTVVVSNTAGSATSKAATLTVNAASACTTTAVQSSSGIDASLDSCGAYQISVPSFAWTFGGNLGQTPTNIIVNPGTDDVGAYSEIDFDYSQGGQRTGGIRVYQNDLTVLFKINYVQAATNSSPFPTLDTYPQHFQHLAYQGIFGLFTFSSLASDSPWVFFDSGGNTFVLSPASDFMVASTVQGTGGSIRSGISSQITSLPAGFAYQTLLVMGRGIDSTYEIWGQAMTKLQGKVRPTNDADPSLKYLGYWTDHGATYYYKFDSTKGSYEQTLLGIRDNFLQQGLELGYMQLDSWFYPKGATADWQNDGGIYEYVASSALFPDGLKSFRQHLGVPLLTHARWIDPASPYRQTYKMSGNVVIDPLYWSSIGSYLHDAGVAIYEQDWLATKAQANFNLTEPKAFMDDMATAMAVDGLSMQYCMPLPHHYLQTSLYSNITSIRTSGDGFKQSNWDQFLYGSQLAGALGVWPWSDVFMSSQPKNLLLSTLSAGPVGVGDPIGALNANNLLLAVRVDGIIVKPDLPLVPLDQTIINDSAGITHPMVASTSTNFGAITAHYVAGYNRTSDLKLAFSPSALGMTQPAYIYNYFTKAGKIVQPQDTFSDTIANGIAYYIVMPVGPSGMAFLGDTGHYVSLGKKRITALTDNGSIAVSVAFASAESGRSVFGYSPSKPVITAIHGSVGTVSYTPSTGLFYVSVMPGGDASATIQIKAN